MIITVRVNTVDDMLWRKIAEDNNETVSSFIRRCVSLSIESEYQKLKKAADKYSEDEE